MVTIHIDFVDGTEVSYIEGLELLEKDSTTDFTTNVLTFFAQKGFVHQHCDNVIIIDKHGRSIDRNELLTNGENGEFRYTDKFMRPGHNIYKMLVANSFTWKQPHLLTNLERMTTEELLSELKVYLPRSESNCMLAQSVRAFKKELDKRGVPYET